MTDPAGGYATERKSAYVLRYRIHEEADTLSSFASGMDGNNASDFMQVKLLATPLGSCRFPLPNPSPQGEALIRSSGLCHQNTS
ncbi:hypothetical protein ATY75_26125 [Rhizobium sp. N122]|nr:hypothetical protein ATY75_26125 [Rhizobium sp. N122]